MTTLKDLLHDFAKDVTAQDFNKEIIDRYMYSHECLPMNDEVYQSKEAEEVLDEKIEEYTEAICKRWVGQE